MTENIVTHRSRHNMRPIGMAVRAVLYQASLGGVLLIKRRDEQQWELPGGTGNEDDMSPEDIITREFTEETSIHITVKQDEPLFMGVACDTRTPDADGIFMTIIYVASLTHPGEDSQALERRVVLSSEHDEYAWVKPIPSVLRSFRLHPETSAALEKYMRKILRVPVELMHKGACLQAAAIRERLSSWAAEHPEITEDDIMELLACAVPQDV